MYWSSNLERKEKERTRRSLQRLQGFTQLREDEVHALNAGVVGTRDAAAMRLFDDLHKRGFLRPTNKGYVLTPRGQLAIGGPPNAPTTSYS
jgi:hypothetical protein